jgi:hypothetical protein
MDIIGLLKEAFSTFNKFKDDTSGRLRVEIGELKKKRDVILKLKPTVSRQLKVKLLNDKIKEKEEYLIKKAK